MKEDRIYLAHIGECIADVENYIAEGEQAFFRDTKTQDAVLRKLQILAESSKRLSVSLKEAHPEVDWRELAGFRNIVVHDYFGINMALVWQIVRDRLPELNRRVAAILESAGR